MSHNSFFAKFLRFIGIVLMVWMYLNAPPPPVPGSSGKDSVMVRHDSGASAAPSRFFPSR